MTHAIAWEKVTPDDVVRALKEYDRLGPEQFFAAHGYAPTTTYDLVWEQRTYPPDEIAIRLHHRLVSIHPFANGNGRHARLMADVLAQRLGRPGFSWGSSAIARAGDYRRAYIEALRAADRNDIQLLLHFART